MSHTKHDRVQETTTNAGGTGALTLAGAAAGCRAFASVKANGDTFWGLITYGSPVSQFEVSLCTFNSAGGTISRGAVLDSSTGSAIDFGAAGPKTITDISPASKSIVEDSNGDVSVTRNQSIGGSVAIGGNATFSNGRGIYCNVSNGSTEMGGGTAFNDGGVVRVYGASGSNAVQISVGANSSVGWFNSTGFRIGSGTTVNSKLEVLGNIVVSDGSYIYTGWNGGGFDGTVRAGMQMDGANQTLSFYTANAWRGGYDVVGNVFPGADNTVSNGKASNRWSVIYSATGTINTSDADEKINFSDLDDTERKIAIALSRRFQLWQWKDAFAAKGEEARWHMGISAQAVADCFAQYGRVPFAYGVVGFDALEKRESYMVPTARVKMASVVFTEKTVEIVDGKPVVVTKSGTRDERVGSREEVTEDGVTVMVQTDTDAETGEPIMGPLTHFVPEYETVDVPATRTVPDLDENGQPRLRMNVRPDQLSNWIAAGFEHRLTLLEAPGTFDALTAE